MAVRANLSSIRVGDGFPVRVLGVINLTQGSFYKGSIRSLGPAVGSSAASMAELGADAVDVGASSTAPYLKAHLSANEELDMIRRAVRSIVDATSLPISVDTSYSKVADAALSAGATIVNDVTGLNYDPALADTILDHSASAIIMAKSTGYMRGSPPRSVARILARSLKIATEAGIPAKNVVLDPGIGFFRNVGSGRAFSRQDIMPWYKWDCSVIRNLDSITALGRPVCVGVSRKSFIGHISGRPDPSDRLAGSISAASIAVYNGASMVRTHDVRETIDAVKIAEALRSARSFKE